MSQIEVMMGRNIENVEHIGRNVINARQKSLDKLLLHQEGS